jgi:hypothetical protein
MKARGMKHQPSYELASSIRSLGIDLFNEHAMLQPAQRITSLLQELFAEVLEVAEKLEEDASAINNIIQGVKDAEKNYAEWAREITYEVDIGVLMMKNKLRVSPEGIQWKGYKFPLESVTRVRWGGVRKSMNGIPTGTTFTIAFGDNASEAVLQLRKEEIFSQVIEKLWRAVCVRIMTGMLEALKAGQRLRFGTAAIGDEGAELTKHRWLRSERLFCPWGKARVWVADGSFVVGSQDDKDVYDALSYINVPNVHVLEAAIRMFFKTPKPRLSSLLEG